MFTHTHACLDPDIPRVASCFPCFALSVYTHSHTLTHTCQNRLPRTASSVLSVVRNTLPPTSSTSKPPGAARNGDSGLPSAPAASAAAPSSELSRAPAPAAAPTGPPLAPPAAAAALVAANGCSRPLSSVNGYCTAASPVRTVTLRSCPEHVCAGTSHVTAALMHAAGPPQPKLSAAATEAWTAGKRQQHHVQLCGSGFPAVDPLQLTLRPTGSSPGPSAMNGAAASAAACAAAAAAAGSAATSS